MEQIRALLERYAQPCAEDCEHSQCPLLRELHAIVISDTLERARLTVKPIVDREREGESVGDLMDMRLRGSSPVAPSPIPEQKHHKHCSSWTVTTSGERNPCDCVCQCAHTMFQHIRPGEHYWYEDCAVEGCSCMKFAAATPVAPSVRAAAEEAAEEAIRCVLGFNELDDLAQLQPDNGNRKVVVQEVAAIFERFCSPVTVAEGDEDGENVGRPSPLPLSWDERRALAERDAQRKDRK